MTFVNGFAWAWSWVRDLMTVMRPCRFSVAIILAGFLLMFTPQGSEITMRLPEEGPVRIFWFMFAVFLWALESWYWARLTLDATFGDYEHAKLDHPDPERMRGLIKVTPRVLAVAAYAIAAIPCLFAHAWFITILIAAEGAAFYVLIVLRRSLVEKFLERRPAAWKKRWFEMRGTEWIGLRALPLFSLALAGGSMLLSVALTVWVCAHVVSFGSFFGTAAIPFLGFAVIVPVGSLAVYLLRVGGRKREGESASEPDMETLSRGYPVLVSLLILAVLWSLFPIFDNHDVRELEGKRADPAVKFTEFVETWQGQKSGAGNANTRPVIVATAGGGLRAAYWTGTVLGRIQDQAPEFRDHLLAISGVSGGSLGATVFLTLLAHDKPLSEIVKPDDCAKHGLEGQYECAGQMLLSQDFLGPAVAGLLFPDLIHRFAPLGFPDRAKALEQSWEASWPRVGFAKSTWTDVEFRQLWNVKTRLPALFLNGTHVESGKRVITSNVKVTLDLFPDAYDFYDMVDYGIRPSTAAHNSARFTYVSPAGTLKDKTHLVDGGYFENFGAATARQVLRAALEGTAQGRNKLAKDKSQPPVERKVRPIVVLISNDPGLKDDDFARGADGKLRRHEPKVWAGELLSPLRAMLHTRDARGLLAVAELRIDVEAAGGDYVEFRLCEDKKGRERPALGWVLSRPAEALMREQMREGCNNDKELAKLIAALRS